MLGKNKVNWMERDWYVDVVIFTFLDHITSFFENQRVLGPWVTIDTPLRIRKLQESEYQTTVSVVFWFGHTCGEILCS